jgi:hypothetical protein
MDFFTREDPLWDWGHNEENKALFLMMIWGIRYANLDLYTETDPAIYADFSPDFKSLFTALQGKGLYLDNHRTGQLGYADSHEWAYSFFLSKTRQFFKRSQAYRSPPDVLLNIDAHHDCFGSRTQLHCGNWLRLYEQECPGTKIVQLYPKWKDPGDDAEPNCKAVEIHRMVDWPGLDEQHRIRHVFICRSGCWTPPHHDDNFVKMVNDWMYFYGPDRTFEMEPIYLREFPTREEAQVMMTERLEQDTEFKANLKAMKEHNRERHTAASS